CAREDYVYWYFDVW
nr:immunoglobulin heavy chain junction region [Mus musculus]MBK4188617.1 immunoglobulin heavy chain junction region [Mus musculus]